MPRTTGTYAAPSNSVNPAVAGTNIDASDFNALVDDLEVALTESVYTSGLGSTDNRLVRTDGTDTKKLQSTGITVDDSNNVSGVNSITLAGGGALREILSANRTYFVRTDGSDSNNGLANTAGGAFLTITKALSVCSGSIDFAGYTVTISIAAGTYAEAVTIPRCVGQSTASNLLISGAGAGSTTITTSAAFNGTVRSSAGMATISGCTVVNTNANGHAVRTSDGGVIFIGAGTYTPGSSGYVFESVGAGSLVSIISNITIGGNGVYCYFAFAQGGISLSGITVDYGVRTFTTTARAEALGYIRHTSITNSGTVTAVRYEAVANGVIVTFGGGASAIAGNSGGTTATGGQYV